jgi:hypothetical protein
MKKGKTVQCILFSAVGLLLLAAGFVLMKIWASADGLRSTLPYLCIGIGAGVFGQNLGSLLQELAIRNDPKAAKQIEIEQKDERNVSVSNRAKAKAYDLMVLVFGALMLAFALMQVEVYVILAFVASYLFVVFSNVYYMAKYQKEM